jgi:hypothetical protein
MARIGGLMSFRNTDAKPEIKYLEDKDVPKVIFSAKVLAIMKYIVDNVNDEVGWLGAVEMIEGSYWVTDIYLPKQEVNGATCELAPDGMHELYDWMLKSGHEAKTEKIHFWGHSHVNMGVVPSGQDLEQSMEKLRDFGGTFFIRAICNKGGQMSVAFYDGTNKRLIENIVWYMHDGIDRKAISDTYGPLVKDNVKKLTYTPTHYPSNPPNGAVGGRHTTNFDKWDNYERFGRGTGGRVADEFNKGFERTKGSVTRRTAVTLKAGGGK